MQITLSNGNETKTPKVGFSWTVLLFGFFVPLLRKDFKWAIIIFLSQFILGGGPILLGDSDRSFIALVANLVFSFIYNKLYIKELIKNGYKPSNEASKKVLDDKSINY
ncbi:hypothetical protein [Weissella minor]|nr:hypothetical protein [Weissella minor]